MTTAVDIITYVGIPLAVLGILPTFYTVLTSYLTLRTVRKNLSLNRVPAITRSSLLSGIVEIEIQRKSIQPLDREDVDYFKSNFKEHSNLKGGSWTLFHWKEMVTGMKSYRLQYHDELAQPQAEIDFERLVAFLLDRGAVPSVAGFNDLRSSGLWTPAGTKLLLAPTTSDGVLTVAPSDDSDGILSLCLQWRPEWDLRNYESLPPYWIRLRPRPKPLTVSKEAKEEDTDTNALPAYKPEPESNSRASFVRLRIGPSGIEEAHYEDSPKLALHLPSINRRHSATSLSPISLWFAVACTAFGAPAGGLWSFAIPMSITHLATRETVPCGVLVLLGLLTDNDVPVWRTTHDVNDERMGFHIKAVEKQRAIAQEMKLPPAQQAAARQIRIEKERWDFHNDSMKKLNEQRRREERTFQEALGSQKLSIPIVVNAMVKWLVEKGHIHVEYTVEDVVEQLLVTMIENEKVAKRVVDLLELWQSWTENGGMRREHFEAVQQDLEAFAYASCVLELVKKSAGVGMGSVVSDLQECLRLWKKVRLG